MGITVYKLRYDGVKWLFKAYIAFIAIQFHPA